MLPTPTTVIRSTGPLAAQDSRIPKNIRGSHSVSAPLAPQHQQTTQAALEQRHLLSHSSLPSAAEMIFDGMHRDLSTLAQSSAVPFVVALQVKSQSSVAIHVQGEIPYPPLPDEFKNFEIPRYQHSKAINFMLRPALHPRGGPTMEFDLGAFLFSRGIGLEDTEPNWYAIKRGATHEEIVEWFKSWLSGEATATRSASGPYLGKNMNSGRK